MTTITKEDLRRRKGKEQLLGLSLTNAGNSQREGWLLLISHLNNCIERVEQELELVAASDARVQLLRTRPGIGLTTGLALVHTLAPASRFANSRKVAAYVGLEPREYSSAERQNFGGISKTVLVYYASCWCRAAQKAVKKDEHLKKLYHRLVYRRDRAKAKVALARQLLVRTYIMLRDEIDYAEFVRRGVAVRSARVSYSLKCLAARG